MRFRIKYATHAELAAEVKQMAHGGVLVRDPAAAGLAFDTAVVLELVMPNGSTVVSGGKVLQALPGLGVAVTIEKHVIEEARRIVDTSAGSASTETTPPTATRIATPPVGTRITTPPEGTRITTPPAGTRITTPPAGTRITTPPAGTRITTPPSAATPSTTTPSTTTPSTTTPTSARPPSSTPSTPTRTATAMGVTTPALRAPPTGVEAPASTTTRTATSAGVTPPVLRAAAPSSTAPPLTRTATPATGIATPAPRTATSMGVTSPALRPSPASVPLAEKATTSESSLDHESFASEGDPSTSQPERDAPDALTNAQKIQLALHGTRDQRNAMLRDRNRALHAFVLKNPGITLDDVLAIAKNAQMGAEIYKQISERADWFQRPQVALALARNPKVPGEIAIRALTYVAPDALRQIAKGTGAPLHVVQAARKKVIGKQ